MLPPDLPPWMRAGLVFTASAVRLPACQAVLELGRVDGRKSSHYPTNPAVLTGSAGFLE